MNRQIRQLALGLMVCYVVLFATLNYWQIAQEEVLSANVENTRAVRREFNKPRGPIITADGVIAARSVNNLDPDTDFERTREYPTGDLLSGATGYFTLMKLLGEEDMDAFKKRWEDYVLKLRFP